MRAFLVLALLSILLEMCQGKHVGQLPNDGVLTKENAALENLPPLFLKRFYDGQSYDGFVGLMGRRMAGTKEIPPALKRDMNDFFVGLMGRRDMEFDTSAALNKGAAKKKGFSAPIKCKLGSI
ncbi:tachykinin-3a isoform X1 [Stegostoma tigrinum]|uniref:tachykinin-3a isoform X1 n=1 Tax=Stegostoma tigrinum TaxID=3053191 RepID=UPI00286FDA2E|nr:tachykinin-3a isoform X1 [Stegostoma tigrinum]XP_059499397.1 tachykinin-3a isoform X1 [Stegostoma tigrinum]XP_059499398.1 tachykinin-3a isoform X1 [Stegostoma tigrinum]